MYDDTSDLDNGNIKYDVLLFHIDFLKNKNYNNILNNNNYIKILASNKSIKPVNFDGILKLPTTVNEINFIVENLAAKKTFNKNEKNIIKDNILELFLDHTKPITKDQIQSLVWKYASDTDTHTVETHIYRLRKKIADSFSDKNFILSNNDGYYIWEKEIK